MKLPGNNNLRDNRTNIKAIATPYYPSVVKAIGRRAQELNHWKEDQFRSYVDRLLHDGSGMFVGWDKQDEPVYDARLDSLDSSLQFDSLLFLLTLKNSGWPPGKYMLVPAYGPNGQSMMNQVIALDDPHYMPPEITRLDSNLFLVNEQGVLIAPMTVWGRRMNYLTNIEETVFVKFRLREGGHHFLDGSSKYYFLIRGIESDIRLEFGTGLMK